MPSIRLTTFLPLAALALLASACQPVREAPKPGDLNHRLMMIDTEGRNYGTVEFDPINGGKIYNATGVLIGRIVAPGETTVTTSGIAPVPVQ